MDRENEESIGELTTIQAACYSFLALRLKRFQIAIPSAVIQALKLKVCSARRVAWPVVADYEAQPCRVTSSAV